MDDTIPLKKRYFVDEQGVLRLIFASKTVNDAATAFTGPELTQLLRIVRTGQMLRHCRDIAHTTRHHVEWGEYIASLSFTRNEDDGSQRPIQIDPYCCPKMGNRHFMVSSEGTVIKKCKGFDKLARYLSHFLRIDAINAAQHGASTAALSGETGACDPHHQ